MTLDNISKFLKLVEENLMICQSLSMLKKFSLLKVR